MELHYELNQNINRCNDCFFLRYHEEFDRGEYVKSEYSCHLKRNVCGNPEVILKIDLDHNQMVDMNIPDWCPCIKK